MAENTAYTGTKTLKTDAPASVTGKVVYGATAITAADYTEIKLGFRPTYVEWENATDRTNIVWYEGMGDNACVKTIAAGTRTLETSGGNGGITVTDTGFRVSQNATLAAILASKTCYYRAEG
jgi:hypothetical protein